MQFMSRLIFVFSFYLPVAAVYAMSDRNMPSCIYSLNKIYFYACCFVSAGVFSVLIYSLVKLRKYKGTRAVHFHQHLAVEILWTTIPFLILVALVVPVAIVLL